MYRAAELDNAHKFISDLPNGYDTDAGEKGGQVSGGQKQRIAIARALIRQPRILELDDVTSNLDTESEHLVHQALLNDSNPCSVLLIAHKLSTVEKVNHIVILEEGKVLEEGGHVELLEKGGTYADLVNRQNTFYLHYSVTKVFFLPQMPFVFILTFIFVKLFSHICVLTIYSGAKKYLVNHQLCKFSHLKR
ncbi:unnamed protein product [Oncorhynchus mykiss]|uniref:ABC transporter domain-containing protein n=1 Tax=Oncorhynchus mykiss TaxID=8022 RepID=A0A060Z3B2_ONCMY|nr:unnamed protein product [Oncorhynchus mykiss]